MLCSDKTGTLTKNKMVIQQETPIYVQGLNQLGTHYIFILIFFFIVSL